MSEAYKYKNFIGVAWPYVNGDLHPGHIVGCYLPADIFARYKRIKGEQVIMVSGTDCFGTPITIQAEKENKKPKDIVKYYSPRITKLLLETYQISFDSFTKTDTKLHRKIVKKFFLNLLSNGFVIKRKTLQYFSQEDQKFLPDRYVEGTCVYCKSTGQRGDQCENCGRTLNVGDLIEPKAKLTGYNVVTKETEHYFVDLKLFQKELIEYNNSNQNILREWIFKETQNWLYELQERAITRDISWGVKIPKKYIPKELIIDRIEEKRFYVWFDAVIGYFSESIKFAKKNKFNIKEFLHTWWDSKDQHLKHYIFVGKDNLFFHTIWWPSLLIGQKEKFYGIKLKLPNNVVVNQFLNLQGQKFSKSRGVYINSTEIVEKYGLDAIRFYLTSIMPENQDANWVWDDFFNKFNNELVNNLGNFIHRTLSFATKYLKISKINDLKNVEIDKEKFIFQDKTCSIYELLLGNKNVFLEIGNHIEKMEFKNALNSILSLAQIGNIYFDRKKPWLNIQNNKEEVEKTIVNCIYLIYSIRILINPILPTASDKISNLLGLEKIDSKQTQNKSKWVFDYQEISNINIHHNLIKPIFYRIQK